MRSPPSHRSRIIAANNILNALFMIASAVMAGALLKAGVTVPQLFLLTGLLNRGGAYIFLLVPEYLLRFIAWIAVGWSTASACAATSTSRRGAAILVCNHVSFVDAILLMAASPRPIVFIMDHRIFRMPVLGTLFRLAKAIPIAPRRKIRRSTSRPSRARGGARRRRPAVHLPRGRASRATARWANSRAA